MINKVMNKVIEKLYKSTQFFKVESHFNIN